MKLFSLLKIPTIVLGFGALVFFAPTCKAQSEVSPDHFDGTDPWEIAARKPVAAKAKPTPATGSYQAQNKKTGECTYCHMPDVGKKKPPPSHDAAAQ